LQFQVIYSSIGELNSFSFEEQGLLLFNQSLTKNTDLWMIFYPSELPKLLLSTLHSKYGAFFMKCTSVILWNFQNEPFQAFLILSMDPFKAPLCGIAVVLFMSMWCVISIWLAVPISFFLFSCYNLLWWHLLMLWFFATLLSGHLKISIQVDLDYKYWEVLNSYEDIFDQYGYVSHLSILNYTSARYSGKLEIRRPKKRVLPHTM
jgi:hypothetical protein